MQVTLSAAGNATLHGVRLALQLPQGWRAAPAGPAVFGSVAPGQAPAATFMVTPPGYAPNATVRGARDRHRRRLAARGGGKRHG